MTVDEHRRKKRRIRRILESNRGRKLALAGVMGAGALGAFQSTRPQPTPQAPTFDDPVKQAVAETMVQRLAGKGWDLPNLDHPRVDHFVDAFQNDPEMHQRLEVFLSRAGQYVPMISAKLAEHDMPHDLIFLAMIESGFDPSAYSGAHASGLWQFMASTAKHYGLRVNHSVDERNHPEKSTEAALDYLTYLHDRFNSWYLAAAAYNAGEGRVARIMRDTYGTEKAASEEAYYKIWPKLPKETRDYVPLMIAAARVAKNPEKYGFENVVPLPAQHVEEVEAVAGTPLSKIAQAAGVPVKKIEALNPQLKRERTPSDGAYPVRVPAGTTERVAMSPVGAPQQGAATLTP